MKKIIPLLVLAALCAGCSNKDSAKIDALNQKVDLLAQNQSIAVSNEFVLFNEIEAVKSQVTNLPDLTSIDGMAYYYHTNELAKLNRIDAEVILLSQMQEDNGSIESVIFTNVMELGDGQFAMQNTLADLTVKAGGIECLLTNGTTSDIIYTRLKLDDVGQDVRDIKFKLGIY